MHHLPLSINGTTGQPEFTWKMVVQPLCAPHVSRVSVCGRMVD